MVKLFASNDRAIRVSLLQHIDQYGESLSAQVVDEQVSNLTVLRRGVYKYYTFQLELL